MSQRATCVAESSSDCSVDPFAEKRDALPSRGFGPVIVLARLQDQPPGVCSGCTTRVHTYHRKKSECTVQWCSESVNFEWHVRRCVLRDKEYHVDIFSTVSLLGLHQCLPLLEILGVFCKSGTSGSSRIPARIPACQACQNPRHSEP